MREKGKPMGKGGIFLRKAINTPSDSLEHVLRFDNQCDMFIVFLRLDEIPQEFCLPSFHSFSFFLCRVSRPSVRLFRRKFPIDLVFSKKNMSVESLPFEKASKYFINLTVLPKRKEKCEKLRIESTDIYFWELQLCSHITDTYSIAEVFLEKNSFLIFWAKLCQYLIIPSFFFT